MLRDRPELAMAAVEESMRHSPAVCSTLRTVHEDAELGGYIFPAGTFIFVNTYAANCDPAVYKDPDRFDITREAPPAILLTVRRRRGACSWARTWPDSSLPKHSKSLRCGCRTPAAADRRRGSRCWA